MCRLIDKLEKERQDLLEVIHVYRAKEQQGQHDFKNGSGLITCHMMRLGELEAELIRRRKALANGQTKSANGARRALSTFGLIGSLMPGRFSA